MKKLLLILAIVSLLGTNSVSLFAADDTDDTTATTDSTTDSETTPEDNADAS